MAFISYQTNLEVDPAPNPATGQRFGPHDDPETHRIRAAVRRHQDDTISLKGSVFQPYGLRIGADYAEMSSYYGILSGHVGLSLKSAYACAAVRLRPLLLRRQRRSVHTTTSTASGARRYLVLTAPAEKTAASVFGQPFSLTRTGYFRSSSGLDRPVALYGAIKHGFRRAQQQIRRTPTGSRSTTFR